MIIQPMNFAYTEFSPALLGINNSVITPGVGGALSNIIDVSGFRQFTLLIAGSQNLMQGNVVMNMFDTENWQTLYAPNNIMSQMTLAASARLLIFGYATAMTFGINSNQGMDDEGDQDSQLVYKRIQFAISESAPGAGSPTTITAKLLCYA